MSQPYQAPSPYPQPAPAGPLFQISLLQHTGALIFWQQKTIRFSGTLEQCEQAYRSAQQHCLLVGWWSVASAFLFNWIAIFSNMSAIKRVRNQARNPAMPLAPAMPPAWYPDPAGQAGQRYWDGAAWTAFTHPPAHG